MFASSQVRNHNLIGIFKMNDYCYVQCIGSNVVPCKSNTVKLASVEGTPHYTLDSSANLLTQGIMLVKLNRLCRASS